MGTVFTIDVRDGGVWDQAIDDVVNWLRHVDAVFSTYRPDSDISRMRRRELRLPQAAAEVRLVLELCGDVQYETNGFFTAVLGGRIDPTGLVKGWAVEQASAILRRCGSGNHAINGGGDLQLAGQASAGQAWRVGIVDPVDSQKIVAVVAGRDFAVATSGSAERGRHILDPFTGRPSVAYASATVVGPSLTRADAYATAAFVMDSEALSWADSRPHYAALLVDAHGGVRSSSRWPGYEPAELAKTPADSRNDT